MEVDCSLPSRSGVSCERKAMATPGSPASDRVMAVRPRAAAHRQELSFLGSRPSSSMTATWQGGSAAADQRQNTTLRSSTPAPGAKLGTTTAAVPAAIRRRARTQLGGSRPRAAKSSHGAGEVRLAHVQRRAGCRLGQVGDPGAVHGVGADGERLCLEREALLCIEPGGLHPARGVERRYAHGVEPAAVTRRALAGGRREGPTWVVGAVDRAR